MRSLSRDLIDGLRHPEFWALSAWLDIAVKSRRSWLGLFWLMVPSIIYVWGVGLLFSSLMKRPLTEFAAHVALGWMIFRFLSFVITEATSVFAGAKAFILDGHMRLSDFILRSIAKACFHFAMSLPVAAVALSIYPHLSMAGVAASMGGFLLILVNTFWVGTMFAVIGARFPDLNQFIGNIFMFLFLLTPIIWYPDHLEAGGLRTRLMYANPFFHLIQIARAPMLGEQVGMISWIYVSIMTVVGLCVAALIYRRFARFVPLWI